MPRASLAPRAKCMCVKHAPRTLGHRFESPVQTGPMPTAGWKKKQKQASNSSFCSIFLRPVPSTHPQTSILKAGQKKTKKQQIKPIPSLSGRDFSQFFPGKRSLQLASQRQLESERPPVPYQPGGTLEGVTLVVSSWP